MRVGARYSHLNGEEFLIVHRKGLWEEVLAVIESVDAESCRTKVSRGDQGRRSSLLSRGYEQGHGDWLQSARLENILRQGCGIPAVPLVLIGVSP